jgi:hypothetical protein
MLRFVDFTFNHYLLLPDLSVCVEKNLSRKKESPSHGRTEEPAGRRS